MEAVRDDIPIVDARNMAEAVVRMTMEQVESLVLQRQAAQERRILRKAALLLQRIDTENLICVPLSPRKLSDSQENIFARRGPGKARKHKGGGSPPEYRLIEMITDLRTHVERKEAKEAGSLYFIVCRQLKV